MAELSEVELRKFRRKIGDVRTPPAYEDTELQEIYVDAGENFTVAVRDVFEELLGNTWRFNDYTQNETQEKKQQIFKNLQDLLEVWQKKVDKAEADAKAANQVRIVGVQSMPPRNKPKPADWSCEE